MARPVLPDRPAPKLSRRQGQVPSRPNTQDYLGAGIDHSREVAGHAIRLRPDIVGNSRAATEAGHQPRPATSADRAAALLMVDLRQAWPALLTRAVLAVLVGIWALVTGTVEIVTPVQIQREPRRAALSLIAGLLSMVAGALLVLHPVTGGIALAILIGAFAVVYGIVLAARALQLRSAADSAPAAPGGPRPLTP